MGGQVPPPPGQAKRKTGGGMNFLFSLMGAVVGALIILLLLPWAFGVSPVDLMRGELSRKGEIRVTDKRGTEQVISPQEGAVSVANIASRVTPSIVNIDTKGRSQQVFLFELAPEEALGSGVIYREDGYILTNNHVVSNAEDITVTLASGEKLDAEVVGADIDNDIAVIKVDKKGLPAIEVGDSADLVVGELVVAVGSPFGFEQSVTAGIISALNRNVTVQDPLSGGSSTTLTGVIQTDAAVNPGNSGGALCDSTARLIGINAVIATGGEGGSAGVGFAVPIDVVNSSAEQIITEGKVTHPYMGVLGQSISPEIADRYSLSVTEGAYITEVVNNGPADKAGIESGDIVVEIDGQEITSMEELIGAVRVQEVGEKVKVTYYRGEDKKSAELTLEEKPTSSQQ